ncbi:MAG TPA: hypothetical protein VJ806_00075 [Luteimonas sp.]|nr:hypothetical protein [Luteimonas sp.]
MTETGQTGDQFDRSMTPICGMFLAEGRVGWVERNETQHRHPSWRSRNGEMA